MSTATAPQEARPTGPRRSRNPFSRVPDAWAGAPGWVRWAAYALVVVFALVLPSGGIGKIMAPDSYWPAVLFYPIGVYVLMALGLNVVVGYAGLLDLGYVAFFAIGAYTMAVLGTKYGFGFWVALPVGIVLSVIAGLLLGAPTLRLRGDYLAIVTLGFGEIIRVTANNTGYVGGPRGISGIPNPPSIGSWSFNAIDPKYFYYLVVLLLVLVVLIKKRLEKSRVGRAWAAIREDEDAAELMGVPTLRFKLAAFATGAAIAGTGGVLFAAESGAITPLNFPFQLSALILAAVVLGGAGNIPGVVLGAFVVAWLPERFRNFDEFRTLIFGGALVLIMVFRPEGLLPSRRRRAELTEGTGGMGSLGGEVGSAATQRVEAAS